MSKNTHKVHARQLHVPAVGSTFSGGSLSRPDPARCFCGPGFEPPNFLPPPFIGAIPNDSFFRSSISLCTMLPNPRPAFYFPLSILLLGREPEVNVEPEATGTSHAPGSSSSEEISMTSAKGCFDPLGLLSPSKLKSSLNCAHENPGPSFGLLLSSWSASWMACLRSASVSGTNSTSSSSESSSSADASSAPGLVDVPVNHMNKFWQ